MSKVILFAFLIYYMFVAASTSICQCFVSAQINGTGENGSNKDSGQIFSPNQNMTGISSNTTGIMQNTSGMIDDAFEALKDSFGSFFGK